MHVFKFRIWPGEISRNGYSTDVRRFEERLHAWRAGKVTGPTSDVYAGLGPPELGEVHGVRPKSVGKAQPFVVSLVFFELLTAGVCVLLGLSFDPDDLEKTAVSRQEINMLISRCRRDLVQAGLAGARLLERAPGGGGTRLVLAPGGTVAFEE